MALADVTAEKIDQGGPPEGANFVYVDISSIDNRTKRITEPKLLLVVDAPSRARQQLRSGDVLVSMTRPNLNAVAILPLELENSVGSTGFQVLRAKDSVLPLWLFYAVQTLDFIDAMSKLVQGALYPAVRPKDVRAFRIPVPPLDEQNRIVAEIEKQFTRLEAGVASLKRVRVALKRYRANVLKAACEGKLVPTEAQLNRQRKASAAEFETGEDLLRRILKERRKNWSGRGKYKEPAASDTGKLPRLPEAWTWLTVETIAFVTKLAGFEYTKFVKYSADGDLAVIKAENADRAGFKRTEFSHVKSSAVAQLTRSQLKPGDLLMVFVGAGTGNVARVPDDQPYFLGPNIGMIRIESREVSAAYVELFLRSPTGNKLALGFAKAVAQPSLSMGSIRKIPVALPPLAEQVRIVAEVERRLSVVDELELVVRGNIQRAERLRQAILHTAFSGQLASQNSADKFRAHPTEKPEISPREPKEKITRRSMHNKFKKATIARKRRPLIEILRSNPEGLSPEDLFREAGFHQSEVDDFYRELATIADLVEEQKPQRAASMGWPVQARVILRAKV
jgi:type I restriction enzyme, S subunit